jgi:Flp pilus assembly protein protease CpaA
MYEAFASSRLASESIVNLLEGKATSLEPYNARVTNVLALNAAASWGAKIALDRYPWLTFNVGRLPVVWGAVERMLSGDLKDPGSERGAAAENTSVGLFAAVVSYTLPDVEREPGKLPAWVYQSLPFVGLALVAGCLVEFGATLRGFCAAVFCLALVIVTATDLEYRLIPNRVVGPASLIVLVGMTIAEPSPRWAIAAFGASLFLLVFSLISPQGMGMGDVKLAFLMGAALGPAVAVALVLASLSSLVPSIVILVRHGRAGRKVGFPFGPFLALGSVLTLFLYSSL